MTRADIGTDIPGQNGPPEWINTFCAPSADVKHMNPTSAATAPAPPSPDDAGPVTAPSGTPWDHAADEAVMGMLAGHVPLSLLADLAMPDGPASREILDTEGLPQGAWWEQR